MRDSNRAYDHGQEHNSHRLALPPRFWPTPKKREKDKAESKDAREFESRLLKIFQAARTRPRSRALSFEQAIKATMGEWTPGVLGRPKKKQLAELLHQLRLEHPDMTIKEIVKEAEKLQSKPLSVGACEKLLQRY